MRSTEGIVGKVLMDLGWLIVLTVTFAVILVLDELQKLNYATSLLLWLIPIVYLVPLFATITSSGTGRRRKALLLTTAMIVTLGTGLDFLLGHLLLRFPGCEVDGFYVYCIRGVPVEELLFYAFGPVAMVLVYACADERWLDKYNPPDNLIDRKLLQVSPPLVISALGAAIVILAVWLYRGVFPTYAAFLAGGALIPAVFLYRAIGHFVNWPAFAVTTLYVALTSVVWEVTLALPRGWWGYIMDGMLAEIGAWSTPHSFPAEAAFVWIAAPFSSVLAYEFAKALMHHPAETTRKALLGRQAAKVKP